MTIGGLHICEGIDGEWSALASMVMAAKIVTGDPDGRHTEIDSDSLRLYRPDGTLWVELPNETGPSTG